MLWGLVLALVLVPACTADDPEQPGPAHQVPWPALEEDRLEATEMGIWLSGEMRSPEGLARNLQRALRAVRSQYGRVIPQVADIRFRAWWLPEVGFEVDGDLRQAILGQAPNVVDSLNTLLNAASMDTFRLNVGNFTVVRFDELYHWERLVEAYESLPGVSLVDVNRWAGDWSNVYPRIGNDVITFLVREGLGISCGPMCCESRFWYFRVHPIGTPVWRGPPWITPRSVDVEYVGQYSPASDLEPEWWDEAKVAFVEFRCCEHRVCCTCD